MPRDNTANINAVTPNPKPAFEAGAGTGVQLGVGAADSVAGTLGVATC
jgi:hypothetical protein